MSDGLPAAGPLERVVNKLDFERLLSARGAARSVHFVLHHVDGTPVLRKPARYQLADRELSTGLDPNLTNGVDNLQRPVWLGCMVPKRHARRAVTRSLLKRQMRSRFDHHRDRLPGGLWLLRLRAPFDRGSFPSAASEALRLTVRTELDALLLGFRR